MQKSAQYSILALIIVPSIINLSVPLYNIASPDLFGLPFFYWFQIVWLIACTGFYLVYSKAINRGSG